LKSAPDEQVWAYARQHGFAIVSKDADFRQRSFLYGHPPKVIWIGLGNCSTRMIEQLLRNRHGEVTDFLKHPSKAFLAFTTLTQD
jgi:predicted nuclease of predicted toxin-antitoxin system